MHLPIFVILLISIVHFSTTSSSVIPSPPNFTQLSPFKIKKLEDGGVATKFSLPEVEFQLKKHLFPFPNKNQLFNVENEEKNHGVPLEVKADQHEKFEVPVIGSRSFIDGPTRTNCPEGQKRNKEGQCRDVL